MDLNSAQEIKSYDKDGVLASIRELSFQIEQAWEEMSKISLPDNYRNISEVVICGMGGSALGARIVDALYSTSVRGPIEFYTDYHVPQYANEKTLVILSSYSGTTEETINCFYEAIERKALPFGITTGSTLGKLFEKEGLPYYEFDPIHNPSNQPRMSLGYSFTAILSLLNKTGFITISDEEIKKAILTLKGFLSDYDVELPEEENLAKKTAANFYAKVPVLIASEHLVGACHTFKNQLNENAKTFSLLFDIPELNHHLMEGLKNPSRGRELFKFLFFESDLYSEGVNKRYPLTQEVIEKNGYPFSIYPLRSETKLEQVLEILAFGSFTAFYLAFLYKEDLAKIPWVDYFKEKMAS